jgi:hypothetical protein
MRTPRRWRKSITITILVIIAAWILLGGVVVRVNERFEGGERATVGRWDHTVWLHSSHAPVRYWFLGVTREFVGAPYAVAFHASSKSIEAAEALIESLSVNVPGGESREVLTTPVLIPYEADPILTAGSGALYNFLKLPMEFRESPEYEVTIKGQLRCKGEPPKALHFHFRVSRRPRVVRLVPFWVDIGELGSSG